jgi:hypothetical protein
MRAFGQFSGVEVQLLQASHSSCGQVGRSNDGASRWRPSVTGDGNPFLKAEAKDFSEATWIEDKFAEGEVYSEMRQVLRDAGRIGTGAIKGPFQIHRISQKCRTQPATAVASTDKVAESATNSQVIHSPQGPVMQATLTRIESIEPTSKCVRAQDCCPDTSCGDNIHDREFVFERAFLASGGRWQRARGTRRRSWSACRIVINELPPSARLLQRLCPLLPCYQSFDSRVATVATPAAHLEVRSCSS